jgi:hypothetical protein
LWLAIRGRELLAGWTMFELALNIARNDNYSHLHWQLLMQSCIPTAAQTPQLLDETRKDFWL